MKYLTILCAWLMAMAAEASTVITNAQVADGTGAPLRKVNVRITDDRIAKVGDFKPDAGEQVIDASGLVLAPGFIDIHNHSDRGLDRDPLATTQIAQGITSIVLGADGDSPWPIGTWLERHRKSPSAPNLALMVGHATVREIVLKQDFRRVSTPSEVAEMATLVEQGMREGAIGMSSGVEYDVASYSDTNELVTMAAAAAKHGGFYMTHIRDEADKSFAALEESIAIGERARIPVQHSHIKLGTVNVWNKAQDYIRMIEAARSRGVDYLADCYPYDAWHSNLKVLVPNKQYEDPPSVARAIADIGGPARLRITEFPPNRAYESHTLEELAKTAGVTPVDMFIRLVREGDAADDEAGVIGQSMTEADIRAFYQQPWVMVASDGGIGMHHPRGAGAFPRVLGLFVREKQWLSLPEAVRKMSALPAQRLGWKDRGTIREGAFADLVLFDAQTVIDRATFAEPEKLPEGIEQVIVNGVVVFKGGKTTGARPGRVLARADRTANAYRHSVVGNPADVKRPTAGLIVLQGGGDDIDENYVRMGAKGGGGDFVVLSATGADDYNDYIYELCHCDSVATLVLPNRAASSDPFVIETIRNAEALFIAGGDQGNYVRFWKGTPVEDAINFVIAKPAPIGGTSAGMAALSEFVYSALGETSLTSTAALANPFDPDLTLEREFLSVPQLRNVITDQHLQERDRIGRTLTLLARLVRDGWSTQPRAIAADRETAVHIDPATGISVVFATPTHDTPYVYFMSVKEPTEHVEKGQPLTFGPVNVYRVPPGGRFDVKHWKGEGGIAYTLSADAGVLRSSRGRAY